MKSCSKCKIIKDYSEFNKNISRKDGYSNYCKDCKREIGIDYYNRNKEDRLKKSKKWRSENRKRCNQVTNEWRRNNPDKNRDVSKRYREKHKEKRRYDAKKRWNKDKEKMKKDIKEWRKNNKEKLREYARKRRAIKEGLTENFSYKDEAYTRKLFNNKCFNCGSKISLSIDHNKPLSGGNILKKDNAVLLCRSCNSSKGKLSPEEFYSQEKLSELNKKLHPTLV